MKNLPLYILFFLVFFGCLIGISCSSPPSIIVTSADISHWLEYDGGYDCYGILDCNADIVTMDQIPTDGIVENLMKDAVGYDPNKTIRENTSFGGQNNIYFVGLQAGDDAPGNYGSFYVFFFDDFTKATSNASNKMNEFDINKPDKWILNDYCYAVKNPQAVKQFFIDKGLF